MGKKIIVLAGSRIQFEDYLAANGLTDSKAVYGFESRVILGIDASEVKVIGTFYDRPDHKQLLELANSRIRK